MRIVYVILFLVFFAVALCGAQTKLDTDKLKAIEGSTPMALPQEPIVSKEKSDSQDEDLKGKVMSVNGESQDLSGTGSTDARHLSYTETYNENGHFVKRISFDSTGNPSTITVYGYLNGARVSKAKAITYDYDPPATMKALGASKPEPTERDVRISYSYAYKYADGKLSEMQMYYNDGKSGMRYTYSRTGKTLEKLAFDDTGNLNQKYVYVLDEKGNAVEDRRIDLTPQRYFGDKIFVFKYDSFDKMGNWTKRTASQIVTVNGNEIVKPAFIHFRTITYFK